MEGRRNGGFGCIGKRANVTQSASSGSTPVGVDDSGTLGTAAWFACTAKWNPRPSNLSGSGLGMGFKTERSTVFLDKISVRSVGQQKCMELWQHGDIYLSPRGSGKLEMNAALRHISTREHGPVQQSRSHRALRRKGAWNGDLGSGTWNLNLRIESRKRGMTCRDISAHGIQDSSGQCIQTNTTKASGRVQVGVWTQIGDCGLGIWSLGMELSPPGHTLKGQPGGKCTDAKLKSELRSEESSPRDQASLT